MSDTPRPHRQPSPRRLFATAVAAAVVSFVLTLSFGFADHAPSPHGVRIAVAAPAGFVQELTTGLAHAAPGGFTVVAAPSPAHRDRQRPLAVGSRGPGHRRDRPRDDRDGGRGGIEPAAGNHGT